MTVDRVRYALSGLTGRLGNRPECPSCGSRPKGEVDRKYFHQLLECAACALLFRYPRETESRMRGFYQRAYRQPGLTTDLPDAVLLSELLQSNFAGTSKDFGRFIKLFQILDVPKQAKILDFGANWGYGIHQFNRAGYCATGYEISSPRAEFGKQLNLEISTQWAEICTLAPFDVAFSAHVIEHTPDPAEALRRQIAVLRPGGVLVAVFPQGSADFRKKDFGSFHRLWGRVHPVLPTTRFLENVLPTRRWFIGSMSAEDLQKVSCWDGQSPIHGDTAGSELLVVYRN